MISDQTNIAGNIWIQFFIDSEFIHFDYLLLFIAHILVKSYKGVSITNLHLFSWLCESVLGIWSLWSYTCESFTIAVIQQW